MGGPAMEEIERGRDDLTSRWIRESWTNWRGRAVEPPTSPNRRRAVPWRRVHGQPPHIGSRAAGRGQPRTGARALCASMPPWRT
ncbi:hypothetical protein VT50_0224630 [Streptomyces antioxidans]|uniref:Uncharacterized protein n=1 Tax=Streptomyces antioxidans TaxID=1507734 RepID=A0A1V4D0C8_9ACTN|nr:hypothetical protein VT50_0224630 [Streptomyces antioxidans]